jgi:uncharacterized protein YaiE (UPF0345 family)
MSGLAQIAGVTVTSKANVFFDGRCVSHTVITADGARKSVGVILPGAPITFTTGAPEIMETVAGACEVKRAGETTWTRYGENDSFSVGSGASFEIRPVGSEPYHYVCHFG